MAPDPVDLFGGKSTWSVDDWTSSDDRVRGGASRSYFACSPGEQVGKFYGTLDIDTLGGAGFASQRTKNESLSLDLSRYDGLQLDIAGADDKDYTIILKDELLPKSSDGREQATTSWEYSFKAPLPFDDPDSMLIRIPWDDFKPTYRGKQVDDVKPLKIGSIERLSVMVRSFFGAQKGDFAFWINSISAYQGTSVPSELFTNEQLQQIRARAKPDSVKPFPFPFRDDFEYKPQLASDEKHGFDESESIEGGSWLCGICGACKGG